ncbi:MAG: cell division protein FtsQ/DivIB [Paracoccaceae bacterium]
MQSLKRDPAPSRWAWRIERLMLTPGVRLTLRAGIPFIVMVGLGAWYLSQPEVQTRIADAVAETRASIEERPEFMVNLMAIDGVAGDVDQAIRAELPIDFPVSSFDLNLEDMRAKISGMDPVKSVSVRIRSGGILQIDVTPRVPVVIWRTNGGLHLLDSQGHPVSPVAQRAERSDLPLIAGQGADLHVREAMTLVDAAAPLGDRLRGLQRVGERRWDLVLDRNQRILLPAENPVAALERMIALDSASDVLARDISRVDLRLTARPTIRMQARATEERLRIHKLNLQSE